MGAEVRETRKGWWQADQEVLGEGQCVVSSTPGHAKHLCQAYCLQATRQAGGGGVVKFVQEDSMDEQEAAEAEPGKKLKNKIYFRV